MSLGEHTKCGLDGDKATLDIETLRVQIERRFYSLVGKIEKKTSKVQSDYLSEEKRKESVFEMSVHGSNELLQLSKDLAETTELLHTLNGLNSRELETV